MSDCGRQKFFFPATKILDLTTHQPQVFSVHECRNGDIRILSRHEFKTKTHMLSGAGKWSAPGLRFSARRFHCASPRKNQPYVRTLPAEFYKQIVRLNGWSYEENCGMPSVLGHWTNDIVYKRLAPGILDELRKLIPRDQKGRLKKKLF
jgi:hypothetical protein